jgi:hypothetical protein
MLYNQCCTFLGCAVMSDGRRCRWCCSVPPRQASKHSLLPPWILQIMIDRRLQQCDCCSVRSWRLNQNSNRKKKQKRRGFFFPCEGAAVLIVHGTGSESIIPRRPRPVSLRGCILLLLLLTVDDPCDIAALVVGAE